MSFFDSITPLAKSLSQTGLSLTVQEHLWVIPVVQCFHFLAMASIVGAVLMICIRILGLGGKSQTLAATSKRFVPWIWIGAVGALATGAIMIIGEPVRELVNPAFWSKMTLLVIGLLATAGFQFTLGRDATPAAEGVRAAPLTRAAAVAVLFLWAAIMIFGRLIAYMQINVDY